jgi:hypothetical protein
MTDLFLCGYRRSFMRRTLCYLTHDPVNED